MTWRGIYGDLARIAEAGAPSSAERSGPEAAHPNERGAAGIRRIMQDRTQWRVLVETWPETDGYHGRFVFAPEGAPEPADKRAGPDALRGGTREDVIAEAYNLPEARLKQLLRSLG